MLILVAVSISLAINGGLFGYAGRAARDTDLAKQDEIKLGEGQLEVDGKYYKSINDFIEGKESEKFSAIYEKTEEYKEIISGVETTTAWIPKGFAVGTSDDINSVTKGLVIRDDQGNEFVWIPVNATTTEEFDNMRTTKNTNYYTEPDTNSQTEYNLMRTSIIAKGGFYVARYEAGYSMETGRILTDSSTVVVPLSKKGAYPYNLVTWSDAELASQSMYTNTTKYGVASTLCYGVQWDAMLSFLEKTS